MLSVPHHRGRAAVLQCIRDLHAALGPDAVLTRHADLLAYDGDAYPMARQLPAAVALPSTTEQTVAAVRTCVRYGVPFVPRGAGTGLSGGATPLPDSVVISTARMNRILATDIPNRRAMVEAGCTNLALSAAVAAHNLHYAPDPSSQGVCTIGGNIAENAGGPHTLKYGVTVNHVTGMTLVRPNGDVVRLGGMAEEHVGYDLVGLTVGSEGTFGIVTEAIVKLTPLPEAVRTLLAVFDSVDDCTQAVVKVLASGVIPCALEMIDRTILMAIEDAFHFGFPREAGAVLTVELDGAEQGLDEDAELVRRTCLDAGAREIRTASDPADRARLWIARKKGVGTAGRLASSIVTQDGAIPRSKLPDVLSAIAHAAQRHGIRVCNIFHAGDGNLHPCVLYDQADPDEAARVHAFNEEVLSLCVSVGGTITGEHGVGIEKREAMRLMFSEADIRWMQAIRGVFDPTGLCNPGKLLPEVPPADVSDTASPSARAGGEPADRWTPASEEECRDAIARAYHDRVPVVPRGSGCFAHMLSEPRSEYRVLDMRGMNEVGPIAPADNLITCQAGVPFARLQAAAEAHGQWVPLDPPHGEQATVGGVVAANVTGLLQGKHGRPGDAVVALRAVNGCGELIRSGARVVKNAAGYDIGRLLAGSLGSLAVITEVTFRTLPRPRASAALSFTGGDAIPTLDAAWHVWTAYPELQHVAVALNGANQLSIGVAGSAGMVEWHRAQVSSLVQNHGLDACPDEDLRESIRCRLNGVGVPLAVRVAAAPHDAYQIITRFAGWQIPCVWLVGSGIIVFGVGSDTDEQAVARLGAVGQACAAGDAAVRWLSAPRHVRERWKLTPRKPSVSDVMSGLKRALDPHHILNPAGLPCD